MKFEYGTFSCDVEVFRKNQDLLIRFYNKSTEQDEDEIVNLVIVDPGYGYLLLKTKGDGGLLSGYLDENIFSSDELVDAAIEFIQSLTPLSKSIYIPYHVNLVKTTSFIEYNGEY